MSYTQNEGNLSGDTEPETEAFEFRKIAPDYAVLCFSLSIIILYEDATISGWPWDAGLAPVIVRLINYTLSAAIVVIFGIRCCCCCQKSERRLKTYASYGTSPLKCFVFAFALVGVGYQVYQMCLCLTRKDPLGIDKPCPALNIIHYAGAICYFVLLALLITFNEYVPRETFLEQWGLTHICASTLVGLVWTFSKEEMHIYKEIFSEDKKNTSFEEGATDKHKEIFSFESIPYSLMLEFFIVAFVILSVMVSEGGQNKGREANDGPNLNASIWTRLRSATVSDSILITVIAALCGIFIIWINAQKQSQLDKKKQEQEYIWIMLDSTSMLTSEIILGMILPLYYLGCLCSIWLRCKWFYSKLLCCGSIPETEFLLGDQTSTPKGTPIQPTTNDHERLGPLRNIDVRKNSPDQALIEIPGSIPLLEIRTNLQECTSKQLTANNHEEAGPSRDISGRADSPQQANVNETDARRRSSNASNEHSEIAERLDMQFFYFGYLAMLLYEVASTMNCFKNWYYAEKSYDSWAHGCDIFISVVSLVQACVQRYVISYEKEDLSQTTTGYWATLSLLFLNICMFFVNLADVGELGDRLVPPKCNKRWFLIVKSFTPACIFFDFIPPVC